MRKVACTIAFLALTLYSIAQKTQKKFEYAYDLYSKKKYDSALYLFAGIYNKGIGDRTLINKSYYNIGIIYLEKKDTVSAKKIFENILTTDFDDIDRGGTGEGLGAEPYALYKNNSCRMLARFALERKDYKTALKYVELSDKEYPYIHFCENEYVANAIYLVRMYAICYEGLGDKERAITTLLPYCLENGNNRLVEELCRLLKEKYSKEEITKQAESAITGIYVKELQNRFYKYQGYFIRIFNTELELSEHVSSIDYRKIKDLKGIDLYRYSLKEGIFMKKLLE